MNARSLTILGSLVVLVIGVVLLLSSKESTSPSHAGEPLFPGLMEKVNDVAELVVRSQSGTITIVRKGENWVLKEKYDYPVNMEKIREVVIGLGELTIIEPKTKKPELYEKLGLEDVDAEGSISTGVTLKDEAGQIIAEVIIGKQRPAKGNPSKDEVYVRKPHDPQTWLVLGKFSVEKIPSEWLDKEFLEIEPKRVRRVIITHPDHSKLVLEKDSPDGLDFKLVNLPKGKEIQSQFTVNNVVSTVTSLGLEDVRPASDIDFKNGVVTALIETFDGIEATVKLLRKDDKNYVKVSAAFNADLVWKPEPETEVQPKEETSAGSADQGKDKEGADQDEDSSPQPPKIKPESEVKAEIDALNKKVADWVYVIPQFRADTILKKPEDLIKKT